jgi:photosystem II stability/assembly factor-like uncharacterized protein
MSIRPKTTLLIFAYAIVGTTGCTFVSNKCPEGFECTPIDDNKAGSAGKDDGKSGGGGKGNDSAGTSNGGGGDDAGGEGNGGRDTVTPGNPDGEWTIATGDLAGTPSACGTIGYVVAKPGEDLLIAGVAARGVFSSTDHGESWSQLGQGDGSAEFTAGLSQVLFDPKDANVWWLSGVRYGSPYRSDDGGDTFVKLAEFAQNDGIAVDFSDPERNTILVGGHEQAQEVEYSADGGKTWKNIGLSLPSDSGHSSFPYVVDESTFLVGTANNQVYRTTDKGAHWTKVVDGGGGSHVLHHSDGSLYWAARETGGLVRSTDDGETWEVVTEPGIVYGMTPIELPDGRIAMRGPLGMLVTDDQGAHWQQVTPPVPNDFWWYTTNYNEVDKAFYTTRFACEATVVNEDALRRFAWDYTKE